ncbi:uncharacterized protein LOC142097085 [Mixophyes fleayi]|uniref:uncharacterized protein LOC142097085 n=1 Tax=Mixophyes fleayi TaxID=3061075 RepID=UPI003F4E24F3
MLGYCQLGSMTAEDRTVTEAKARTLCILNDALNKKDWLLVETGAEDEQMKVFGDCPVISTELVDNLITTLQNVTILKDDNPEDGDAFATVYPTPNNIVIGLCRAFWLRKKYLDCSSCPGAFILIAASILGYRTERFKEHTQHPLTADGICAAFEIWMNHRGIYHNGSYSCCGETSRDSVCEASPMRLSLFCLSDEQKKLAQEIKQTTLKILLDAQKKHLLVDKPDIPDAVQSMTDCPLITSDLVRKLIIKLQHTTFEGDVRPRTKGVIAYVCPKFINVIYLCPLFWKEKEYLGYGSRPGTIILHVAHMLGYRHILNSDPEETKQHNMRVLTADGICNAFEFWMNHQKPYTDGSYPCCGETERDSVCEKSFIQLCLKEKKWLIEKC